jgi:hypothetical protein
LRGPDFEREVGVGIVGDLIDDEAHRTAIEPELVGQRFELGLRGASAGSRGGGVAARAAAFAS